MDSVKRKSPMPSGERARFVTQKIDPEVDSAAISLIARSRFAVVDNDLRLRINNA
jgi:hypothetical protein